MRKIILFLNFSLVLLIAPEGAHATFFNDGRWYMDSSWWTQSSSGDVSGAQFIDQNDRLEWNVVPTWNSPHVTMRSYLSDWSFNLQDDFVFSIEYRMTAPDPNAYGALFTGVFNAMDTSHGFGIGPTSDKNDQYVPINKFFVSEIEYGQPQNLQIWERTNETGILYIRYDSANDELRLETETQTHTYAGLRTVDNIAQVGVWFTGDASGDGGGGPLNSGDAYLKNFQIVNGTLVPEPVSSSLFLLGGGTMLARWRFRKLFPVSKK